MMMLLTTAFPSSSFLFKPPPYRRGGLHTTVSFSGIRPPPPAISDDFVLKIAEQLEDSVISSPPPSSSPLETLRSSSSLSLLRTPWPNRRNDAFRFTDLSYLRSNRITIPTDAQTRILETIASPSQFESPFETVLAITNGNLIPSCSRIGPHSDENVYVGALSNMPAGPAREHIEKEISNAGLFDHKDLFYDFNAVGLQDLIVVDVPEGVKLGDEMPVHLMFGYSGAGVEMEGSLGMSNPRVLVVARKDAEVSIVEEHFGLEDERGYWANAVVEFVVEEGARVVHSYVQRQGVKAAHTKWTIARQKSSSTYQLVEVSTGGKLSRHNLHIQQLGPETMTDISSFHLSTRSKQIQDLHSSLVLDHPRGYSRQLHKCIISDSGNGIFDGNIKVNRYAQQTDAGQETKCLLLSPQALVNVKPNLQIIADDVKCTHGAAISGELDKNELFYFQARGIDIKSAMDILTFSFGAHVITRIPHKQIQEKVTTEVREMLTSSRQNVG